MARAKNQNFSKGASIHARRAIAYVVLIILSFLCLFWFWILFVNMTRTHGEISKGFTLVPSTAFFSNLKRTWTSSYGIDKGLINSIIIAVCSAVFSTYFSALTAYAIHAYEFKGKKAIHTFILAIMMIPTNVTALGLVRLVSNMKLEDSLIPLIVPTIAAPVTFFYMKQYMESVLPLSIIEASRIDGAGEFRTFNQIILPIMKPAIAVQAIFTFVSSWNNFFVPALILSKKKTMPILLSEIRSEPPKYLDDGQVYMSIGLAVFPVVIVYLCLSKFIVGGVAAGSVKG